MHRKNFDLFTLCISIKDYITEVLPTYKVIYKNHPNITNKPISLKKKKGRGGQFGNLFSPHSVKC